MDILVPDSGSHQRSGAPSRPEEARPGEARVWGLVCAAVVLGFLFLIGIFERNDRVQVAAGEPVILRAPAPVMIDLPPGP